MPVQDRDKDFTLPVQDRDKDFPPPVQDQDKDFTLPVQGRDKDFTLPVQDRDKDFTRPVQDRDKDFTRPIQDKDKDFTLTVQDKDKDFPLPVQDKDKDFTLPVQDQDKDFPPPVQDKDKDFTLPVQDQDKDFPLPVQDKDKDFTLPVQDQDKDFTLPVQDQDKDFTLPVQDQDKDFTRPVQDQDKDFTLPVQDQDKDFTLPVQDQDKDSTRPVQDQDKDFTRPVQDRDKDFTLPVQDRDKDFTRPVQDKDKDFTLPVQDRDKDFTLPVQDRDKDFTRPIQDKDKDFTLTVQDKDKDFPLPVQDKDKDFTLPVQDQDKDFPPPVQDKDKDFTLPVQDQDKDFPLPVQDKDKDFTLPVQDQDKDFTLPVQDQDKDFTLPVQDQDKDFTRPVQDQDKDFTLPVQDQDKDFTLPVQDQDKDSTRPVQDQDKDFTRPVQDRDKDFTLPVQDRDKDFTRPVQDKDKDFTLPVQDRDKDFTLPVQDRDKDFTRPIQDKDKDFTLTVQDKDKDFPLPVQDKDKDFTLPVQDQDKDFPPPVQDKDKDFTLPVQDQDKDFPLPVQDKDKDFTRPVQDKDKDFTLPVQDKDFTLVSPGNQDQLWQQENTEEGKPSHKIQKDVKEYEKGKHVFNPDKKQQRSQTASNQTEHPHQTASNQTEHPHQTASNQTEHPHHSVPWEKSRMDIRIRSQGQPQKTHLNPSTRLDTATHPHVDKGQDTADKGITPRAPAIQLESTCCASQQQAPVGGDVGPQVSSSTLTTKHTTGRYHTYVWDSASPGAALAGASGVIRQGARVGESPHAPQGHTEGVLSTYTQHLPIKARGKIKVPAEQDVRVDVGHSANTSPVDQDKEAIISIDSLSTGCLGQRPGHTHIQDGHRLHANILRGGIRQEGRHRSTAHPGGQLRNQNDQPPCSHGEPLRTVTKRRAGGLCGPDGQRFAQRDVVVDRGVPEGLGTAVELGEAQGTAPPGPNTTGQCVAGGERSVNNTQHLSPSFDPGKHSGRSNGGARLEGTAVDTPIEVQLTGHQGRSPGPVFNKSHLGQLDHQSQENTSGHLRRKRENNTWCNGGGQCSPTGQGLSGCHGDIREATQPDFRHEQIKSENHAKRRRNRQPDDTDIVPDQREQPLHDLNSDRHCFHGDGSLERLRASNPGCLGDTGSDTHTSSDDNQSRTVNRVHTTSERSGIITVSLQQGDLHRGQRSLLHIDLLHTNDRKDLQREAGCIVDLKVGVDRKEQNSETGLIKTSPSVGGSPLPTVTKPSELDSEGPGEEDRAESGLGAGPAGSGPGCDGGPPLSDYTHTRHRSLDLKPRRRTLSADEFQRSVSPASEAADADGYLSLDDLHYIVAKFQSLSCDSVGRLPYYRARRGSYRARWGEEGDTLSSSEDEGNAVMSERGNTYWDHPRSSGSSSPSSVSGRSSFSDPWMTYQRVRPDRLNPTDDLDIIRDQVGRSLPRDFGTRHRGVFDYYTGGSGQVHGMAEPSRTGSTLVGRSAAIHTPRRPWLQSRIPAETRNAGDTRREIFTGRSRYGGRDMNQRKVNTGLPENNFNRFIVDSVLDRTDILLHSRQPGLTGRAGSDRIPGGYMDAAGYERNYGNSKVSLNSTERSGFYGSGSDTLGLTDHVRADWRGSGSVGGASGAVSGVVDGSDVQPHPSVPRDPSPQHHPAPLSHHPRGSQQSPDHNSPSHSPSSRFAASSDSSHTGVGGSRLSPCQHDSRPAHAQCTRPSGARVSPSLDDTSRCRKCGELLNPPEYLEYLRKSRSPSPLKNNGGTLDLEDAAVSQVDVLVRERATISSGSGDRDIVKTPAFTADATTTSPDLIVETRSSGRQTPAKLKDSSTSARTPKGERAESPTKGGSLFILIHPYT